MERARILLSRIGFPDRVELPRRKIGFVALLAPPIGRDAKRLRRIPYQQVVLDGET